MSFLDRLIRDPLYQQGDPRPAEEFEGDVIVSPDTRREKRLPPGQTRTRKWPVLDAHGTPQVDLETWQFEVGGLVERPLKWSLDEFLQLPAVKVYADFHCVTRWSRLDNLWGGVSTRTIAELVGVKPEAKFVVAEAHDYGWTTNLPLEYFLAEDSLFAWTNDGRPIPPEHGGPMPPLSNLTIPEQDDLAPEEDWTSGLSLVRRGIQNEDWREIMNGIVLSLEQTRRYERERGYLGQADDWHDRSVGIKEPLTKGVGKWMPEELMNLAERATKK